MRALALLLIGLLGSDDPTDYSRSLGSKALDQPTLDAEGYGERKASTREADGLRITLAPGEPETGWKTPPQLRFGGNFTISANFVIKKLPKPAQEDGAAIGLAIAFQDPNQPDVTLVRVLEPNGSDVYLSIEKPGGNPMQMQMQMQMNMRMMMMAGQQPGGKPPKPPRHTFPAAGDAVRMELVREGKTIRYQVVDAKSTQPRYLGQVELGPNDVMAVKLFATNRNGAEPVNVLFRDLTIRADRINGLGTAVRTVYDEVVYADPTRIEKGSAGCRRAAQAAAAAKARTRYPARGRFRAVRGRHTHQDSAGRRQRRPRQLSAAAARPAGRCRGRACSARDGRGRSCGRACRCRQDRACRRQGVSRGRGRRRSSRRRRARRPGTGTAYQPTPKARIPLDEVDSIRFERSPALTARFVGQLNLDFTMPGLERQRKTPRRSAEARPDKTAPTTEAKKDRRRPRPRKRKKKTPQKPRTRKRKPLPKPRKRKRMPLPRPRRRKPTAAMMCSPPHRARRSPSSPRSSPRKTGFATCVCHCFGLREAKIKQVTVNCQTDKGPTSWRLDTTDSQDWPLVIRRPGNDISADLFLEPPPGDCHQKNFMIMVMYEDGQAGNANVMVQEHTDPKLAVDPKKPAVPLARCLALPDGRRKTLRQARGHRPGNTATHDALARPSRGAARPRRRGSHRRARSQGIARVVRQTAENARVGRPAAGPDEKRRGHRDSRHPGRRRQRQAAISLSRPHPDDAAQARWKA